MGPTKTLIVLTVQALTFQIASSMILDSEGKARAALIQLMREVGRQESDYQIEVFQTQPDNLAAEKIEGQYYEESIAISEDGRYTGNANNEDEVIGAVLVGDGRPRILEKLRGLPGKVWRIVAYEYSPGDMGGEYGDGFHRDKKFINYAKLVFFGEAPVANDVPVQSSIILPKHFNTPECIQQISRLLVIMNDIYEKDLVGKPPSRVNPKLTPVQFLRDEITKQTINFSKK